MPTPSPRPCRSLGWDGMHYPNVRSNVTFIRKKKRKVVTHTLTKVKAVAHDSQLISRMKEWVTISRLTT